MAKIKLLIKCLTLVVLILCILCLQLHAGVTNKNVHTYVDASSNNFPPMNFLDQNDRLTGFGHELASAVIKSANGKVVNIHSKNWYLKVRVNPNNSNILEK